MLRACQELSLTPGDDLLVVGSKTGCVNEKKRVRFSSILDSCERILWLCPSSTFSSSFSLSLTRLDTTNFPSRLVKPQSPPIDQPRHFHESPNELGLS